MSYSLAINHDGGQVRRPEVWPSRLSKKVQASTSAETVALAIIAAPNRNNKKVNAPSRAQLQEKAWWLANAIGPTWRGGASTAFPRPISIPRHADLFFSAHIRKGEPTRWRLPLGAHWRRFP
jgi:hypothetical protein